MRAMRVSTRCFWDVEEGVDLNAEIVFEIKYGGSVTETWS
jgi:hypothetical protein